METLPISPESPAIKKRNPFIAFLLSFLAIGLGQIYNGQLKKGLLLALGGLLIGYPFILGLMGDSFKAVVAFVVIIAAYSIYAIAEAVVVALRSKDYAPGPYNRWQLYLLFIVLSFGLNIGNDLLMKHFAAIEAFKIPAGSMMPTILIGDHIIADRSYADLRLPARGDVIVFRYPRKPERNFIKRIIAIGGDSLEIRDRRVYLNNKPLDEPYLMQTDAPMRDPREDRGDNHERVLVPKGKYFVMGDNRQESHDSRAWGYVDRHEIKGKALYIYWSWDRYAQEVRFDRIGMSIK